MLVLVYLKKMNANDKNCAIFVKKGYYNNFVFVKFIIHSLLIIKIKTSNNFVLISFIKLNIFLGLYYVLLKCNSTSNIPKLSKKLTKKIHNTVNKFL